MSKVVEIVTSGLSSAWENITSGNFWEMVQDSLDTFWDEVTMPLLEWVFGLLGITDEEVISVEVSTNRVIQDTDGYSKSLNRIALDHQSDPNGSVISKLTWASQGVAAKYSGYMSYGRNKYYRGLPTTNIKSNMMDKAIVKSVVDSVYSVDSTIMSAMQAPPTKESWVAWQLQESNNYSPAMETLDVGGIEYVVTNIDYNYGNDEYDVYYSRNHTVNTTVTTTTTITITPILDDLEEETGEDNKNTTVTEQTVVTSSIDGITSDETVELSNVDETIPADTEEDSEEIVVEESNVTEVYETGVISTSAYVPTTYAIVKYYTVDSQYWKYWLYDMEDDTYPEIAGSAAYYDGIEFFPVIVLRNNQVNINSNKDSDDYKQTRDLCKIVGIDVDQMVDGIEQNPEIDNVMDAFVNISVNLSDSTPEIDKLVYETFANLYEDTNLYNADEINSNYNASILEHPFNVALSWRSQAKTINSGSIGSVGTYQKTISGETLIVSKQTTATHYITYEVIDMTAVVMIDREGETAARTFRLSSGKIEMPLPFFFVDALTPIEQTKLFPYTLKISVYAAQIQTIDWYNTGAFKVVLQIIAIIIIIVVSIYSLGTGTAPAVVLMNLLLSLAIGVAVQFAMQKILESDAPDWLKAVAAVVVLIAAFYFGTMASNSQFMSAENLTSSVTEASTNSAAVAGTSSTAASTGTGFQASFGAATESLISSSMSINSLFDGIGIGSKLVVARYNKEREDINKEQEEYQQNYDAVMQLFDENYELTKDKLSTEDIIDLNSYDYKKIALRGPEYLYNINGFQYEFGLVLGINDSMIQDFHSNMLNTVV